MKRGKAVGPDKILLEFWLEMGDCGLKWLTALFNKIKSGSPMSDAFRKSYLLPFYKNKGDSRKITNRLVQNKRFLESLTSSHGKT